MPTIVEVLMKRDGMSRRDAQDFIVEGRIEVLENGADPDEILLDWFGLEPDYLEELMGV